MAERFLVGGEWRATAKTRPVINPFKGEEVFQVSQAEPKDIDDAIAAAQSAFLSRALEPTFLRTEILRKAATLLADRKEEFSRLITTETGKPIMYSRQEVDRAILTLSLSSEEARRIEGTVLPLDQVASSTGRMAIVRRFPLGPVGAITPFNFPVNLVAHKLGPAIASACPVVLKPSSNAPVVALRLGTLLMESGLPPEYLNIVPCSGSESDQLVTDQRIKLITFTGSPAVGWPLKERSGKKRVVLELGGNAAVIVHSDANLPLVARKILLGGFSSAGQSCISVQRVFAQRQIYEELTGFLVEGTGKIAVGDPWDDQTVVGPMISEDAAKKAEDWVNRAVAHGGKLLTGGKRTKAIYQPTILTEVPKSEPVVCNEVFAPVIVLQPYESESEVIREVNDSPFGLQAGLFTNDARFIFRAFRELEVGGVIVNDVSSYRMDSMPYGGVKDSGFGREGIRYAIEEMTEMRLLALSFDA